MALRGIDFKWYDGFFLSMLATSAIIVSINWKRYRLCTYPLHIWIVVDYTTVFVFRVLMFVDNGLAAGMGLDLGRQQRFVRFCGRIVVLSILVLVLYPFLWAWTVIGSLWYTSAKGCLPEEGQKWGFLIWLLFSYCGLICIACMSTGKAMVDRHSSITTKKLTTALQMLSLDKTMVALSDYGRDHRLLKKLMVTHLLGSAPQKRNRCMRVEMLQRIIDSMYSQLKINYNSVGTIMNMSKIILDQLFPFALKQVIGRDIESVHVEEMGTVVSQQQIYELVVGDPAKGALEINWRDFIPYVSRWLPNRKLERKLKNVIWRRSAIVKALIQQQRELLLRGKEASGYLDMLLEEGQQLEDKQLETAIWEPIIESSITTHVALEWALFELGKDPKCQDRVHKELEEVCGDQLVTEDDLRKLPYLKAIFHETVRKYPPLPLIPLRYVHEDVELAGYHVPAGWQILVNIYGANNYQGEWQNPEMWKPERHLEVKEETKMGADDEAADLQRSGMTFGAGKRLCAGWMQGMVIACMTIARIVQNFQWELPVGHDEEDVETITNTGTHRLRPLLAVLNPRTKSN